MKEKILGGARKIYRVLFPEDSVPSESIDLQSIPVPTFHTGCDLPDVKKMEKIMGSPSPDQELLEKQVEAKRNSRMKKQVAVIGIALIAVVIGLYLWIPILPVGAIAGTMIFFLYGYAKEHWFVIPIMKPDDYLSPRQRIKRYDAIMEGNYAPPKEKNQR